MGLSVLLWMVQCGKVSTSENMYAHRGTRAIYIIWIYIRFLCRAQLVEMDDFCGIVHRCVAPRLGRMFVEMSGRGYFCLGVGWPSSSAGEFSRTLPVWDCKEAMGGRWVEVKDKELYYYVLVVLPAGKG